MTGIADEQYGVNIYPNPIEKTIIIDNLPPAQNTLRVELLNDQGAAVSLDENLAPEGGRIELDTRRLNAGLYHYRIQGSAGFLLQGKLIKV